jgi:SAM-dependent methyltransferase
MIPFADVTPVSPPGTHGSSPLHVWAAGVEMGFRALRREPLLGAKKLVLPVSYWRTVEFGYVLRHLDLPPGGTVLDLGSPKDLAVILARRCGYRVVATDILPSEANRGRRIWEAQRRRRDRSGTVRCQVVDGRDLPYADDTFDASYSVSVIEHIPEVGDEMAARELVRVTKPGGRVVITVPFAPDAYESHLNEDVYERKHTGKPVFWERHYDFRTLESRLVAPSQGRLKDLEIWGESRVRVEKILSRFPMLRLLLSPAEALVAWRFLTRADVGRRHFYPMAALFCLQKPLTPRLMTL